MARYIDVEIAKECFEPSDLDGDCFDNYDNVIRILNAVQTEDVAPIVRGKWVSIPLTNHRECSRCGHNEPYKFADKETLIYRYCPFCGAKMEESEEE